MQPQQQPQQTGAGVSGASGVEELFRSLDQSPEEVVQEIKQLIQEQFSEGKYVDRSI